MNEKQKERMKDGMEEIGFSLTDHQLNQFKDYLELLQEWNQKMNLTAIKDADEILTHHFLDSATCSLYPTYGKCHHMLDLGTGAGFPGIPLKILFPEQSFVLMDSLNKRLVFLEKVKETLGLTSLDLVHARAEEAARQKFYRENFDAVVSRAVASLPVLLEYTIPFLKVDGWFFCQKGPQWKEEIEEAKRAMQVFSVQLEDSLEVKVPFTDLNHQLLVFRKTKATQKTYPRKAGTPSKKPILNSL
ncbi:16S rRNA m(7)G-527 methyltransferase [Tindallia magadiensis]|uniref:Ribosomal RNA small subunit methyltransferase G n=1 Tax=Tindallia magadiensis TaxID=69895 RepID=A0A1I3G8U6_9FIRM|nr:16S rRNA (guanine(527)-N(7))-methyltransferase RsmG [Tindallia magadiensis]SFI19591.1 16S rRNA m(7)G-527 methyltransferase [Tindallia magadiensis]